MQIVTHYKLGRTFTAHYRAELLRHSARIQVFLGLSCQISCGSFGTKFAHKHLVSQAEYFYEKANSLYFVVFIHYVVWFSAEGAGAIAYRWLVVVSALNAPFWVVKEAGFLDKEGLDANLVYIPSSSTMAQSPSFG